MNSVEEPNRKSRLIEDGRCALIIGQMERKDLTAV